MRIVAPEGAPPLSATPPPLRSEWPFPLQRIIIIITFAQPQLYSQNCRGTLGRGGGEFEDFRGEEETYIASWSCFCIETQAEGRRAGGQEEYTTDDDDDRTKGVQAATLFKVFTCRPRPSRQRDPVAFPSAAADVGSGRRKGCTGHDVAVHWDSVSPRNRDSLNSTQLSRNYTHRFLCTTLDSFDGHFFSARLWLSHRTLHKLFTHNVFTRHGCRPGAYTKRSERPFNLG